MCVHFCGNDFMPYCHSNFFIFFLLKDGARVFDDFLREGLIEYLDVNEENNALVCQHFILC